MPKLKALGHACFTLSAGEHSVIFDPWLQGNPEAACGPDDVEVDAILASHGHDDHLGDAVSISKRLGVPIIAPYELTLYCGRFGCQTVPLAIGGGQSFEFGHVKLTQALHTSTVVRGDHVEYVGMACGFIVTMGGAAVYYAGDTGIFGDMKLLGELHDLRAAILPIGDKWTMGPEDALVAAEMLRADVVVPTHCGRAFDGIEQDVTQFADQLRGRNIRSLILKPGQEAEI